MGSLAVSRLAVEAVMPSAPIADQVADIARKNLAPQAVAIDEGTVYPDELLRRLGDVGAWGSHQPLNGQADLRCAIQSIAALGEVCGATAFMAWCQNTLVWYAANSDNPKLASKFADNSLVIRQKSPAFRACCKAPSPPPSKGSWSEPSRQTSSPLAKASANSWPKVDALAAPRHRHCQTAIAGDASTVLFHGTEVRTLRSECGQSRLVCQM